MANTLQLSFEDISICLEKIRRSNLNAFISVQADVACAAAVYCDQVSDSGGRLGALHGMPVAIKDLIDVAGIPTTCGSRQHLDRCARSDATVVSRLRAQGAIIIGKTNTHEFAYGSTGDNSYFGAVLNPYDKEKMAGGSSSGSAAAVAEGLCEAAIGTDTSASIRVPAALCGVVGMKPTYGLLPTTGIFELSKSLDHVGPITRDVRTNSLLLEAMADRPGAFSKQIGASIQGLKIGRIGRFYGMHIAGYVRDALDNAFEILQTAGAHVIDIDIPEIEDVYQAQQFILKAEAYATHRENIEAGGFYSDEVLTRLDAGKGILAKDYLRSIGYRHRAVKAFDQALLDVDCVLTPTCGVTAPPLYERKTFVEGQELDTFFLLTRLTAPTNLSGHPSLSVPFGESHGLPIGLQIIGPRWQEETVYQLGHYLEAAG